MRLLANDSILKINSPLFRSQQSQVSMLSNEAIHNMFSLVCTDLIKQVKTEDLDPNKSNVECWKYLFYLGFWKKLVFIVDSMNSLKLCYTTGDLQNYKIVYLMYYRELDDEQVKQLAQDKTGLWIDNNIDKTSELGIMCYKVLLEEIMQDLQTDVEKPEFECNLNLNKWIKADNEENVKNCHEKLTSALKIAINRLRLIMGSTKSVTKLQIFDMSVFFGRVFSNKQ